MNIKDEWRARTEQLVRSLEYAIREEQATYFHNTGIATANVKLEMARKELRDHLDITKIENGDSRAR